MQKEPAMSRLSLEQKLPAQVTLLLLATVAGLAWVTHSTLRRATLDAARDAMTSQGTQLSQLLSQSAVQSLAGASRLADDERIRAFLRDSTPASHAAARSFMDSIKARLPQVPAIEVRDASGRLRLLAGRTLPAPDSGMVAAVLGRNSAAVGGFEPQNDTLIYYSIGAPVTADGKLLGMVVDRRRLTAQRQSVQVFNDLMGPNTSLKLSDRGGVWTDLGGTVKTGPAFALKAGALEYEQPGGAIFGLAIPIESSPWFVVLERPREQILAPVRLAEQRILILGAIVLLFAAIATRVMSRRLTAPLRELTAAATDIADGALDRRASVFGEQEVTQLAKAFNSMAGRVAESTQSLEDRVRKRTEALRQSEERSRRLLETANDAIVSTDANGKIMFANPAAERTFAQPADKLVGRPLGSLSAQPWSVPVPGGMSSTHTEGAVLKMNGQRSDGSSFPMEVSLSEMTLNDETGYTAILRDVSERERLNELSKREAVVRQSEALLRRLLESNVISLAFFNETDAVTSANDAFLQLLGYSRVELERQEVRWSAIAPPDQEAQSRSASAQLRSTGVCAPYETEYVRRDGSRVPVLVGATSFEGEGLAGVAFVIDLTPMKTVETNLRRSNEELERFAYVASHDLQEPLRMVHSYVQLLARRYQGKLGQDADEFIGYAIDGSSRMKRLIEDLLAFSRSGKRELSLAAVDTNAVLNSALGSLRLKIAESNASVTADSLPAVQGDAGQLEQVFMNLVSNALKFRRDGEQPQVHVGVASSSREHSFFVRDNGIGIEPQYFDRIFVIFQRLHGRDQYAGTGMGLAICKKIIERHQGRMWVESATGAGSTFFFSIPANGRLRA
jgi:PAS domain S-box-containing protein